MSPRDLTIFEGCDGVGKTTLARAFAEATGARYFHHGPYPDVTDGASLAARYEGSIADAILGRGPVVIDRSWLSEPIYGAVFRGGRDRMKDRDGGMTLDFHDFVEDAASRCAALVVVVSAPWEVVLAGFRERRGLEMLDGEGQLAAVHAAYRDGALRTSLPSVRLSAWNDGKGRWRSLGGGDRPGVGLIDHVKHLRLYCASAPKEG